MIAYNFKHNSIIDHMEHVHQCGIRMCHLWKNTLEFYNGVTELILVNRVRVLHNVVSLSEILTTNGRELECK